MPARCLDLGDQWRQLLATAASGEDGEPFGRKFLGNCSADEIARTDHRYRGIPVLQLSLLHSFDGPIASRVGQSVLEDFAGRGGRQRIQYDDLERALVGR